MPDVALSLTAPEDVGKGPEVQTMTSQKLRHGIVAKSKQVERQTWRVALLVTLPPACEKQCKKIVHESDVTTYA